MYRLPVDDRVVLCFILAGLIKFFGNVAHYHPDEIHENLQVFMQKLVELLHDSNVSLRIIAVETVAHISDSLHGKYSLFRNGEVQLRKMQFAYVQRIVGSIRVVQ